MRKIFSGLMLAALAASMFGGGTRLVQHNAPAGEAACAGARSGGKCDLVWLNYSVESRYDDRSKVNCPSAAPTTSNPNPRCYESWQDSKRASSGWGTTADKVLVPAAALPGFQFGGVTYGTGAADARIWTGLSVAGGGDGSAAVGAGRNASNDPFLCVTAYGRDGTDGRRIGGLLNQLGISDDTSDDDSDAQLCGEILRGVL